MTSLFKAVLEDFFVRLLSTWLLDCHVSPNCLSSAICPSAQPPIHQLTLGFPSDVVWKPGKGAYQTGLTVPVQRHARAHASRRSTHTVGRVWNSSSPGRDLMRDVPSWSWRHLLCIMLSQEDWCWRCWRHELDSQYPVGCDSIHSVWCIRDGL